MGDLQCAARVYLVGGEDDAAAVRARERVVAEYDLGVADPLTDDPRALEDLADRHRGEAVLVRVAGGPVRLVELDGDGRRVSAWQPGAEGGAGA